MLWGNHVPHTAHTQYIINLSEKKNYIQGVPALFVLLNLKLVVHKLVSLHKTLNLITRMAIWAGQNLIKWWKMWLKIKLTVFSIPAIQWEIIKSAWMNSDKWCLKRTTLNKNELWPENFIKSQTFPRKTIIWTSLSTWASPLYSAGKVELTWSPFSKVGF